MPTSSTRPANPHATDRYPDDPTERLSYHDGFRRAMYDIMQVLLTEPGEAASDLIRRLSSFDEEREGDDINDMVDMVAYVSGYNRALDSIVCKMMAESMRRER